MLILLPPSERKATRRRGTPARYDRLAFSELTPTRERLRTALAQVSAEPDAYRRLGLAEGLVDQIEHNTRLDTAPALPAEQLYTGVVYDALGLDDMPPTARRRARASIVVVSALFGALRLTDRVPPYRLSAGNTVPGMPGLAALWRPALDTALPAAAGKGVILDCRSGGYMAMWTPPPPVAERWVHVVVPGASHMAKHTRGEVARAVCCANATMPRTTSALFDLVLDELGETHEVRTTPPVGPKKPWTLSVRPRA